MKHSREADPEENITEEMGEYVLYCISQGHSQEGGAGVLWVLNKKGIQSA